MRRMLVCGCRMCICKSIDGHRNSENMTPKYPDIVARLPACLAPGVDSCVLDGEAVGWDPEQKKILPFQVRVCGTRGERTLFDCVAENH